LTQASELCYTTIIQLFKQDITGEPSLEAVRLLNRMIKERKYEVHPKVISCLLHLRLKQELNVRASQARADKEETKHIAVREKDGKKMRKKDRPHLSKKAKKVLKDNKAIEAELKEAGAEVDREARSAQVHRSNSALSHLVALISLPAHRNSETRLRALF
jgi:nucleolar complex protein 3